MLLRLNRDSVPSCSLGVLRTRWRAVERVWQSVWATGRSVDAFSRSRPESVRRAIRFGAWLVKAIALSGETHVVKELKALSDLARSAAILGGKIPSKVRRVFGNPSGGMRLNVWMGQISHLGRSLPVGTKAVVSAALRKHREVLLSPPSLGDPWQAFERQEFASQMARRFPPARKVYHVKSSSGATLESTRRTGGLSAVIPELFRNSAPKEHPVKCPRTGLPATLSRFRSPEGPDCVSVRFPPRTVVTGGNSPVYNHLGVAEDLSETGEPCGLGYWEAVRHERHVLDSCLHLCSKLHQAKAFPIVTRVAIPERGGKARVVTKSPAVLQLAGQLLRQLVLSSLRHWPPIADVIKGDHHSAITRVVPAHGRPANYLWVSTDLSAATDTVYLEFIQDLWCGLSAGWGLSDAVRRSGLLLLGPHWLSSGGLAGFDPAGAQARGFNEAFLEFREADPALAHLMDRFPEGYPLFASVRGVQIWEAVLRVHPQGALGRRLELTRRGILMGNPLTWVMLNVSQAYAVHKAFRIALDERRFGLIDSTFSVCGDDLVALWPRKVVEAYRRVMTSMGYVFSPGKDFLSVRGGVFTEVLFETSIRRGTTWREGALYGLTLVDRSDMTYLQALLSHPTPMDGVRSLRAETRKWVKNMRHFGVKFLRTVPLKGLMPSQDAQFPRWFTLPSTVESLRVHCREDILLRVCASLWPTLPDLFRRVGVPPSLPRILGGSGLPWGGKRRRPSSPEWRLATNVVWGRPLGDPVPFLRLWSPDAYSPSWGLAEELAGAELDWADPAMVIHRSEVPPHLLAHLRDLLSPVRSYETFVLEWQRIVINNGLSTPMGREFRMTWGLFARKVRNLRKRLADLYGLAPPHVVIRDVPKAVAKILEFEEEHVCLFHESWVPSHGSHGVTLGGWWTRLAQNEGFYAFGFRELLFRVPGPDTLPAPRTAPPMLQELLQRFPQYYGLWRARAPLRSLGRCGDNWFVNRRGTVIFAPAGVQDSPEAQTYLEDL
uniref:RNA-dependent RNA polymerase n=1 Tax=Qingyuan Narna tick virus 1 TaxID=2972230 RepID=A0A9E8AAD2_9VIRU|nr:MAG: RNA-dependent RNA polymerase [Qingyuan Narna tick virus 1]